MAEKEQIENDIKKLKNKRSGVKLQLTNLRKFIEKIDPNSEGSELQLKYRFPKLQECSDSYTEIYKKLVELASELENEESIFSVENDRCEFEDSFFEVKYRFEKCQKEFVEIDRTAKDEFNEMIENKRVESKSCKSIEIDNSSIGSNDGHNKGILHNEELSNKNRAMSFKCIKLPQVTLPRFDGRLEKWLRFRDSFRAMIINNPGLTEIERFYYLDGNLDGEAKRTIELVEFSEEGFKNAWSALITKYDNKKSIIEKHMSAFFNLKKVNRESAIEVRKLLDDSLIHMRALENLGEKVNDIVAVHTVKQRLDCETRKLWENESNSDRPLTWTQLVEFLQRRCQVLQALDDIGSKSNVPVPCNNRKSSTKSFVSATTTNRTFYCALCKQSHFITNCEQFLKMTVRERYEKTRQLGLCLNCLKGKHRVAECRGSLCRHCNRKHSSFLHMGKLHQTDPKHSDKEIGFNSTHVNQDNASSKAQNSDKCSQDGTTLCCQKESLQKRQIVLSTAVVFIRDAKGRFILCRALLDSASQSNFATEKLVDRLQIEREELSHLVSGLNQVKTRIQSKFSSHIKSRISNYQTELEFLVVPEIAGSLPASYINVTSWNLPSNLELADPSFNQPKEVDLLLGAEIFFKILNNGRFDLAENLPTLQNTAFGWIVSGRAECYNLFVSEMPEFSFCNFNSKNVDNIICSNSELDKRLTKFWECESFESNFSKLSLEERKCEDIFRSSYKREQDGRFVVKLPFRENVSELGGLGNLALKRFMYLESKLNQKPDLKVQYSNFLKEYEKLGHMAVSSDQTISDEKYFLPHHAIFKPNSSSTKLRVVFDASARTNRGLSLNDVLMTGPVVQSELFNIVLRFRKYVYVYTTDIEKMYRQVKISDEHTPFQKILWRQNNHDPIQVFELKTVTYGTSAAPYLATKVLQQLGINESKSYPLASKIIQEDFYVDDGLFGSNNLEEAIDMRNQLIAMLQGAGMKLRKWTANSEKLLESIPLEDREVSCDSINETIKTLGLMWHPNSDQFIFHMEPINFDKPVTKRNVLSEISKLFDPLGLISPVIVIGKVLMQHIWLSKAAWDECISENLSSTWLLYREQLICINNLKLDRCLVPKEVKTIEIHGFADASERAYGACVYLRCTDDNGKVAVNLICSKSRIAPLKVISIPRLELGAAHLLSKLVTKVIRAMELPIERVILWSDSSIALSWIRLPPYKLKTYVANRTSEIQTLTEGMIWRHINGKINPADHVSRGRMPKEFLEIKDWWNGPMFLYEDESNWPNKFKEITQTNLPEVKKEIDHLFLSTEFQDVVKIENYSSLTKLTRVMAYCLRFGNNSRPKKHNKMVGNLSTIELSTSVKTLLRIVQSHEFAVEIKILRSKDELPKSNRLSNLSPFIDPEGLLRVGGRLKHSSLDFDYKHQYLLSKHHFTSLIIQHEHRRNLHSGVQATLASVRQRYWPINGKNLIKKVLHTCIDCFRINPKTLDQVMGNLPSSRIQGTQPFNVTGIDFCGPLEVKYKHQRKGPFHKIYLCLFICFVVKAVHIEVVEDATSDAFIACLKRFIARRGRCSTIWTDNGTNFVGANNKLKELAKLFESEQLDKISHFVNDEGIEWKFIPPRSPHFGGLWEAGIKSLKTHLKKVMGSSVLTLEQIYTLSAEIEGIMNSRPLTALSSDPNDEQPLTPAHFLIGRPINCIPEPSLDSLPTNRLSHWQTTTQMAQHFWRRFSREYIHTLQEKRKWVTRRENLRVNDLVLVQEENLPSTRWLLGRVETVIHGKDQKIRVVTVKTKNGIIKRAVTKLAKLPISN